MFLSRLKRVAGGLLVLVIGYFACLKSFTECQELEFGYHMRLPFITLVSVIVTGFILGFVSVRTRPVQLIFALAAMTAATKIYWSHSHILMAGVMAVVWFLIGMVAYMGGQTSAEQIPETPTTPHG